MEQNCFQTLLESSENPAKAIATTFKLDPYPALSGTRLNKSMASCTLKLNTAIAAALVYAPSLSSCSRNFVRDVTSLSSGQLHKCRILSLSSCLKNRKVIRFVKFTQMGLYLLVILSRTLAIWISKLGPGDGDCFGFGTVEVHLGYDRSDAWVSARHSSYNTIIHQFCT